MNTKLKCPGRATSFTDASSRKIGLASIAVVALSMFLSGCGAKGSEETTEQPTQKPTLHKTIKVKGLDIFYREAGPEGAPVGFRLAAKYPERVESLIVQNGNAYEEGLREFWDPIKKYWQERTPENAAPLTQFITPDGVKWQYTHGVRDEQIISPDNWNVDPRHLTRDGNPEIQLALFYSYGSNPPLYPEWQAYFREHQPPTLIVWGKNDYIFPAEGAEPYKRDLKEVDFHLLDTGHFALEEDLDVIANYIRLFLTTHVIDDT